MFEMTKYQYKFKQKETNNHKKQYLHGIQLYKLQKLPAGEHIRDINKWIRIDNCYFIFVINYWFLSDAEKAIRKLIRISSEADMIFFFTVL